MLVPREMEAKAQPQLVVRIKVAGGDLDWSIPPGSQLLFRDVLDVIGQVLPDTTTTAFEYEDEDGDRITVRSDEEMKAMFSYYSAAMTEQQVNGEMIEPLQIYPRACKPPGRRNIHGLKVNTRAGSSNNSCPAVTEGLPNNSLKKSSAELKKILANGQMNEQDIQYRDILGHGNGGTVYNHGKRSQMEQKVKGCSPSRPEAMQHLNNLWLMLEQRGEREFRMELIILKLHQKHTEIPVTLILLSHGRNILSAGSSLTAPRSTGKPSTCGCRK